MNYPRFGTRSQGAGGPTAFALSPPREDGLGRGALLGDDKGAAGPLRPLPATVVEWSPPRGTGFEAAGVDWRSYAIEARYACVRHRTTRHH